MRIGSIGSNLYTQQSQQVDPTIKAQLDALGLKTTGSKQGDLAAIKAALAEQSQSGSASQVDDANKVATQQTSRELPWATLMSQLGIQQTGSKEGDFAAIGAAIEVKASKATTVSEKAEVKALQQDFAAIQSQDDSNSLQSQAQAATASAQNQQSGSFTGQNQLAELNKFFLLKMKA